MSVRAADALAAMRDMPLLSFGQLAIRGLVVVAPHPDDESLGCGGLIAAATTDGIPVRIVVVSDGAGSHPNSVSYPPARLRHLRESETLTAAAELGVAADAVAFLGLPDRYVPSEGPDAGAHRLRPIAGDPALRLSHLGLDLAARPRAAREPPAGLSPGC